MTEWRDKLLGGGGRRADLFGDSLEKIGSPQVRRRKSEMTCSQIALSRRDHHGWAGAKR
jgi:hypothetical protein